MEYRVWGAPGRPLVLLLHALGCHSGWWAWTAPLLAERYHVVAPDFRGHGDTPRADDYSFKAYAADVERLVQKLGAGPCALVGHSMGGYVALTVAARKFIQPTAIIVADMKTSAPEQELADLKAASQKPSRTYATLDEAAARYRLSPPDHVVPAQRLAAVARESYRQLPDGTWAEKFDRRALAIDPLAPGDLAARLNCPALFLRGEHSVIMPAEPAAALAAAAKAPLATMPGLHHHLPLEDPEGFAAQVTAFLK
ncbi:MAG: tropinesterase [Symbiobacteriaceae bacterium]|jgi:pimeloyl-ACP methyl ester carboxylesterase|nr:tropinesterase [Symbiobacteriaceae bacterium]